MPGTGAQETKKQSNQTIDVVPMLGKVIFWWRSQTLFRFTCLYDPQFFLLLMWQMGCIELKVSAGCNGNIKEESLFPLNSDLLDEKWNLSVTLLFMIPTFPTIISYFHTQNTSVNWLPSFYPNLSYILLILCLCSLPFPVWNDISLVLIHLNSTFALGASTYGPIIKKTFHIKPVPSPGPGTGISLISLNEKINF